MAALDGKVAVVTGATSGIGNAIVRRLAEDGASVVIADLTGAEEAAKALVAEGLSAAGTTTDVSDEADVAAMAAFAEKTFGGLDILVNNAALFSKLSPGPFTDITPDLWMKVMAVNTLGPFLTCRAAVPLMRRRGGGAILNIASNTVHKGTPTLLHYVSSKGAVIAMTRALSREVGPDAITVNALAPGFTLSDGVLANDAYGQEFRSYANSTRSMVRDQVPADLVGAAAFLCGPDSRFMTGQTVVVDGGGAFV